MYFQICYTFNLSNLSSIHAQIYIQTVTYFVTEMPPRIKQMTRGTRNARLIRVMPSSKGHLNTLQSFTCVHPVRKCQSRSICHFLPRRPEVVKVSDTENPQTVKSRWPNGPQRKIFLSVKWVRGLVKVDIWSFKLPGQNVPVCFWDFRWITLKDP